MFGATLVGMKDNDVIVNMNKQDKVRIIHAKNIQENGKKTKDNRLTVGDRQN